VNENLLCRSCVRRSQDMRVRRPLKTAGLIVVNTVHIAHTVVNKIEK